MQLSWQDGYLHWMANVTLDIHASKKPYPQTSVWEFCHHQKRMWVVKENWIFQKYTYETYSKIKSEGQFKSTLNVKDWIPVIISKTNFYCTGHFQPSEQQQTLQQNQGSIYNSKRIHKRDIYKVISQWNEVSFHWLKQCNIILYHCMLNLLVEMEIPTTGTQPLLDMAFFLLLTLVKEALHTLLIRGMISVVINWGCSMNARNFFKKFLLCLC